MTVPDPPGEASAARAADRALRAAARHSAGRLAAASACSVAAAGAALAEPAVLGHTLDLLLRQDPAGARWTAWCAVVISAEVLLDAATARLTGGVDARSTAWLRRLGLGRLLRTAPHRAVRHSPGELSARLTAQATTAGAVPAAVVTASVALLPPLGGLVALVLVDVWTALAFLAGIPLLALLLRAFARDSGASVSRYQEVQLDLAGRLVEALGGARTIAAAGTAEREQARVLARLPELGAEGRRTWRIYGATVARTGALMPLLLYVVLGVGGVRLSEGALGVGGLLAAVRYAGLAAGVGAVTGRLAAVVRGRAAARRTAALFELPELPQGERRLPTSGPGTLELRGVRVVRAGTVLLHDVYLRIPGGATAVVVGRSGSGKTTLAAVAGRLTACDAGRVLLDGVPLDELSAEELRREVGHAFERPALFGGASRTPSPSAAARNRARSRARTRGPCAPPRGRPGPTPSCAGCPRGTTRRSRTRRCPAGSCNVSAWHGRSAVRGGCSSWTTRRRAWTPSPPARWSGRWPARSGREPAWSSPTASPRPPAPTSSYGSTRGGCGRPVRTRSCGGTPTTGRCSAKGPSRKRNRSRPRSRRAGRRCDERVRHVAPGVP